MRFHLLNAKVAKPALQVVVTLVAAGTVGVSMAHRVEKAETALRSRYVVVSAGDVAQPPFSINGADSTEAGSGSTLASNAAPTDPSDPPQPPEGEQPGSEQPQGQPLVGSDQLGTPQPPDQPPVGDAGRPSTPTAIGGKSFSTASTSTRLPPPSAATKPTPPGQSTTTVPRRATDSESAQPGVPSAEVPQTTAAVDNSGRVTTKPAGPVPPTLVLIDPAPTPVPGFGATTLPPPTPSTSPNTATTKTSPTKTPPTTAPTLPGNATWNLCASGKTMGTC